MALLVHKIAVSPQSVAMERINGNGNISTWKDEEDTDEDEDIFSFAVVVAEPPPMTSGFPKRGE
jgi:hypothetical protein